MSADLKEWFESRSVDEQMAKVCYWSRLVAHLACLAIVVLLFWPSNVHAQQLDQNGCGEYAIWSRDILLMRDVGADKEKLRAYLEKHKAESAYFPLILRNLDELWKSQASQGEVLIFVYRDCIARRGRYGQEI